MYITRYTIETEIPRGLLYLVKEKTGKTLWIRFFAFTEKWQTLTPKRKKKRCPLIFLLEISALQ